MEDWTCEYLAPGIFLSKEPPMPRGCPSASDAATWNSLEWPRPEGRRRTCTALKELLMALPARGSRARAHARPVHWGYGMRPSGHRGGVRPCAACACAHRPHRMSRRLEKTMGRCSRVLKGSPPRSLSPPQQLGGRPAGALCRASSSARPTGCTRSALTHGPRTHEDGERPELMNSNVR